MIDYDEESWFAMRDLKRSNAKLPAYKMLAGKVTEVFTPLVEKIITRKGKKEKIQTPFMPDLLFAKSTTDVLNPIVDTTPTLQYRYKRGGKYCEPVTVRNDDMNRFIGATRCDSPYKYYTPEEVSPALYGRKIKIVGGSLNGFTGRLMTKRGSKVKRLIVELDGILAVGVEIQPEFIQIIEEATEQ